jgi:hypothetical protein
VEEERGGEGFVRVRVVGGASQKVTMLVHQTTLTGSERNDKVER